MARRPGYERPLHHMHRLEQRLPEKEIHLLPDEGHVTLFYRHMEEILRSASDGGCAISVGSLISG